MHYVSPGGQLIPAHELQLDRLAQDTTQLPPCAVMCLDVVSVISFLVVRDTCFLATACYHLASVGWSRGCACFIPHLSPACTLAMLRLLQHQFRFAQPAAAQLPAYLQWLFGLAGHGAVGAAVTRSPVRAGQQVDTVQGKQYDMRLAAVLVH